jgi:cytidylate kinase
VRQDLSMRLIAIVITGPPGAGKTSVLNRLATLLEIDGIEFGALETEHFGWGSPWLSGAPVLRQLQSVLGLQRDAGRRRFLITATTETNQELAEIVQAIDADTTTAVLLTASPEVVAARIRAREPDDWPGKSALIEHAEQLAASMPSLAGIDVRLNTDDHDPTEVARELLAALRTTNAI